MQVIYFCILQVLISSVGSAFVGSVTLTIPSISKAIAAIHQATSERIIVCNSDELFSKMQICNVPKYKYFLQAYEIANLSQIKATSTQYKCNFLGKWLLYTSNPTFFAFVTSNSRTTSFTPSEWSNNPYHILQATQAQVMNYLQFATYEIVGYSTGELYGYSQNGNYQRFQDCNQSIKGIWYSESKNIVFAACGSSSLMIWDKDVYTGSVLDSYVFAKKSICSVTNSIDALFMIGVESTYKFGIWSGNQFFIKIYENGSNTITDYSNFSFSQYPSLVKFNNPFIIAIEQATVRFYDTDGVILGTLTSSNSQFKLISVFSVTQFVTVDHSDTIQVWNTDGSCPDKCQTCITNSSTCQTCASSTFRISPPNCDCQAGYYGQNGVVSCSKCHNNCDSCYGPSDNNCSACSLANNRELSGQKCVCKLGFIDSGSALCTSCSSNCLTCESNSSILCATCADGYYLNSQKVCIQCHELCQTCNGPLISDCLSCNLLLHRIQTISPSSCDCANGYSESSPQGLCVANNCNGSCLTCQSGSQTLCSTCHPGYYLTANKECNQCHQNCKTCDGSASSDCLSCDLSVHRSQISQQSECICDSGYQEINGNCQVKVQCNQNCLTCQNNNINQCLTCKNQPGWVFDNQEYKCYCSAGYFLNSNINSCEKCQTLCKTCLSPGTQCTSCFEDYELQFENRLCIQRIESHVSKETIKTHQKAVTTSAYVAIGSSVIGSIISISSPNGDASKQMLTLQKLFFLLLIDIPYPQLVYSFLSTLGGMNPLEALKKLNIFESNEEEISEPDSSSRILESFSFFGNFKMIRLLKEIKGYAPFEQYMPNKFYTEKVKNSILINSGGLLVGLFIVWIFFIFAIWISRRQPKVYDETTNKKSPSFLDKIQQIFIKVATFIFIAAHEVFILILSFSIVVQLIAICYFGYGELPNSNPNFLIMMILFGYSIIVFFYAIKLINIKNLYEESLLVEQSEVRENNSFNSSDSRKNNDMIEKERIETFKIKQLMFDFIVENLKKDEFWTRNFKIWLFLCESVSIPFFLTIFFGDFKIQLLLWLVTQLFLAIILISFPPRRNKIDNFRAIIEVVLWIAILIGLLFIGIKIKDILENNNSYSNEDVDYIDKLQFIVIICIYIQLFLSPIISIIKIVLLVPEIKKKMNEVLAKKEEEEVQIISKQGEIQGQQLSIISDSIDQNNQRDPREAELFDENYSFKKDKNGLRKSRLQFLKLKAQGNTAPYENYRK